MRFHFTPPQVVVNCITVLNEILADEGGIAANQAIVHHLLSRYVSS